MVSSYLLATGPELPTDYSLENPSDLTHSLTLWQPDLSLPRTIGNPLCFDAALVNNLVPCAWLLSGALEVWSLRLRYQMTATGRGCGHQTRLMFSCQEPRLKWAIGPLRSLVHVLGTAFLQLFGQPRPFLHSKNS